ncbi:uncharacterized protein LOC128161580 [Crassostrea angulata]|uniref:uncharacterized protein LOC128161580 n=1 Tax=Magallana angulata TaxID=2784310 RepID=UPI0022B1AFA4|nr:uncharacterized protein LOC128161580 [Crassostrea angulata]
MICCMCILYFMLMLVYSEATGPINQTTAASRCRTLYDSQLIPRMYIEDHNLTGDIIQELNPGESAWIDGKIQNMGCYQEKCLKIKKILQRKDRKLPYICVNSKSIEVNTGYVLYKESEKLCDEDKFSMRYMLDVNELIQRLDQLNLQLSNQTFWIPNVKLTENSDTLCTFVTTRDNSLDTFTGNCSIHQLGICINNSYIPDYQLTLMLEMTSMNNTTDGDQSNSSVESTLIICREDLSGLIWIAVSFLTMLVLLSLSIILWKKRSASMRKKGKLLENEKHLGKQVI